MMTSLDDWLSKITKESVPGIYSLVLEDAES